MTPKQWYHLREEHEFRCAFACGRPSTTYVLLDPSMPATETNAVPACQPCAIVKGARSLVDWVRDHVAACA